MKYNNIKTSYRHFYRQGISVFLLVLCLFICVSCGSGKKTEKKPNTLEDGEYSFDLSMEGGTGKAYINSPVNIKVENGIAYATLIWSSKSYDYMIVNDEKYLNEANADDFSTFTVKVSLGEKMKVIADTVAMSTPHEIEYTLYFYSDELNINPNKDDENAGNNSSTDKADSEEKNGTGNGTENSSENANSGGGNFAGLTETGKVELKYAKEFSITEYGEYKLIEINTVGKYFVVPKNSKTPKNLPKDVTVLKQPLDNTYMVSTSVMDMVREIGALDYIKLTGTREKDWYISEVKERISNGKLVYAGKYSAPDYELLLSKGCNLAIENTMISHNPEVKEKLIELKIPVLIERSSYEEHPFGRLEWIKLYGALYDKSEIANEFFEEQINELEQILEKEKTNYKVVFFYVSSNGAINIRKPNDYIAKMIELAGGKYVFEDLKEEENSMSTMNMQMEDFYLAAKDADVIIYNSTIEGELKSIGDLTNKSSLFLEFKAVKNGNVYCTANNFFQETTGTCKLTMDIYKVLQSLSGDEKDMNLYFLKKVS